MQHVGVKSEKKISKPGSVRINVNAVEKSMRATIRRLLDWRRDMTEAEVTEYYLKREPSLKDDAMFSAMMPILYRLDVIERELKPFGRPEAAPRRGRRIE